VCGAESNNHNILKFDYPIPRTQDKFFVLTF